MKQRYTIRPARRDDADAVGPVWQHMAEQHRAYDPEVWCWALDAPDRYVRGFAEFFDRDDMVLLVAEEDDGALVGVAVGNIRDTLPTFQTRTNGFVWDLCVLPTHRRRGIGRRLMEEMFDEMKRRGCDDVILHVALRNRAGIRLYEKLGMRPVMYRMYKRL